jgi:uncharacterized protein
MKPNRIAFDRASVRSYDQDGRMHVEICNISKSNVCGYRGDEIPDYETLVLDPTRIYQLLRDPEELEKAAATFNSVPLLMQHKPTSADDHPRLLTVGTTGSDTVFKKPYLKNSLVIWDQEGIDLIESGEQKELSPAYHYRADMTPGTYEGVHYDGVMRDISGNHLALVPEGRTGNDVVVGDSKLETAMSKNGLSLKGAVAKGALAVFLRPKLAQDAKIDLNYMLKGITSANWKASKPKLAADIKAKVKLAKDADLEDLVELLDTLDGEEPVAALDAEEPEIPDDKKATEAKDAEPPAPAEHSEEDEENLWRQLYDLIGKMLKDEKPAMDNPPPTPGTPKPPVAEGAKPEGITKPAMDAAIAKARDEAVTATMKRMRDIADAEKIVRPYVGEIAIAQDSAEAVYRLALEAAGVDLAGVPSGAYRAMVQMLPKTGTASPRQIAEDTKLPSDFDKMFPNANRVRAI